MATTSDLNGETTTTTTTTTTAVKRTTSAVKENQQQQQLPCPRCDSVNTKFCYYNNYNFSQPRHFCKGCRRYWTHGGALRDIPVGGGSRRSSTKRPRSSSSNSSSPTTPLFLGSTAPTSPLLLGSTAPFGSLLTAQVSGQASGFLALGGFGGFGLEDVGSAGCFGVGRGFGWANFSDHLVDDGSAAGRVLVGSGGGGHTWQLENGGGGAFVGGIGDCFPWPDLAISTPGHRLK